MRFSVATMTLAASGVAAAGISDESGSSSNGVADQQRSSAFRHQQTVLKAQTMGSKFRNHGVGHFTHGFSAKHVLKNGAKKQCVPKSQISASTSQGDFLGVLSCGLREYCAENDASSLGGFCEPNTGDRSLQYGDCIYWNPIDSCVGSDVEFCEEQDEDYTCDCGMAMVDPTNTTRSSGQVSCELPSYCALDQTFAPCPSTCWEVESDIEFSPQVAGYWEYSEVICTTFSSPYSQTFCRGESGVVVDGALQNSCNMSLDGVYCTSCSVGTFEGNPQTDPDFFDAWDCTNVGLGASPAPELGEFASRFNVQPPLFTESADCSRTDAPVATTAPSAATTPDATTMAPAPTGATTPAPSPSSSTQRAISVASWMTMGAAVGSWLSAIH